jgi:hypothetical protein
MSVPDSAKIEVLKVWYSVFCTLMDAYRDGNYERADLIEKLEKLRDELADRVPELEDEMRRSKH